MHVQVGSGLRTDFDPIWVPTSLMLSLKFALLGPMLVQNRSPGGSWEGVWGLLGRLGPILAPRPLSGPPLGKLENGFWPLLGPKLGPCWPQDGFQEGSNFDININIQKRSILTPTWSQHGAQKGSKMSPKRPWGHGTGALDERSLSF